MARDIGGVSRANMFETLRASDGTTYTPQSGQNCRVVYRSSGGEEVIAPNMRYSGDELQQLQRMQAEYPSMYGARR